MRRKVALKELPDAVDERDVMNVFPYAPRLLHRLHYNKKAGDETGFPYPGKFARVLND